VQQMSIGSVGSIQSPMHHNLSVHSQPSSVPVNEQNILSPIPPSDVSPPSMTPSLENNIDQKPDMQHSNNIDKTMDSSQAHTSNHGSNNASKNDFKNNNHQKQSDSQSKDNLCLKRPALVTQDCENISEEDCSVNQILYDYSTWDAWYDKLFINSYKCILMFRFIYRMNHPIKRFKADDLDRYKTNKNLKYDLYSGQQSSESSNFPNFSNQMQNFNDGVNSEMWKGDESKNPNGGKEIRKSESDDKTAENLFTSEGLQPSYADLNKIFDNSDDNSNDVSFYIIYDLTWF
jgi:mediator of RNA polymerase II transcription subunit 13